MKVYAIEALARTEIGRYHKPVREVIFITKSKSKASKRLKQHQMDGYVPLFLKELFLTLDEQDKLCPYSVIMTPDSPPVKFKYKVEADAYASRHHSSTIIHTN